jgi:DNA-binding response OmpR family regulator
VERHNEVVRVGSRPAVPELPPGTPEVLVVEDNIDMRRLLHHLVGQEFRVRLARDGREGLAAVRERAPDLVLTDVMMPEMSGTELCAAIKSDPALASVPVVLVTSKAEREMKIQGLEYGADDYVTKPFHPRELLARVRSLVRLRQAQQQLAERNALLESTNEELQTTMDELKEAGAQLVHAERLAAVGELAAGVAHEINNPVNFAMNAGAHAARRGGRRARGGRAGGRDRPGRYRRAAPPDRRARGAARELGFDESAADARRADRHRDRGARAHRGPGRRPARLRGAGRARSRDPWTWRAGLRTTLRLMGHTLMSRAVRCHPDIARGCRRSAAMPAPEPGFPQPPQERGRIIRERGRCGLGDRPRRGGLPCSWRSATTVRAWRPRCASACSSRS